MDAQAVSPMLVSKEGIFDYRLSSLKLCYVPPFVREIAKIQAHSTLQEYSLHPQCHPPVVDELFLSADTVAEQVLPTIQSAAKPPELHRVHAQIVR
jgi:hypothetical protein